MTENSRSDSVVIFRRINEGLEKRLEAPRKASSTSLAQKD